MPLTKSQKRILSGSFLFRGMDDQTVKSIPLLDKLEACSFCAGEKIYTVDSFRRELGFIVMGSAVVTKDAGVELNTLRVGDCFGVAAVFGDRSRYVSVVKAKSASEVVFISRARLEELFADYPVTAVNYISFLSGRINFLNDRIDSFTAPTARDVVLLYLSEAEDDGRVQVYGGYSALARRLNMGRASLYRIIDALQKDGLISRSGRAIVLEEHFRDALKKPHVH